MKESMHVLPWQEESDVRIASTLDIKTELTKVKPYSFEEYSLCFEAALDKERPISDRERYLLARFGREYVDSPDKFNQHIDNIEQRLAQNVGNFALIQNSPTFVTVIKIASDNLRFLTGNYRNAYGSMSVEESSYIGTIVDDNFKIVPELTRDFVDVRRGYRQIAEGTTRLNITGWKEDDTAILDPEKPCEHEGDEFTFKIGMNEISEWQQNNLKWAEHVDNMMNAWNTPYLLNLPAAHQKRFDSSLDYLKLRGKM